jgi:hypothetical protein
MKPSEGIWKSGNGHPSITVESVFEDDGLFFVDIAIDGDEIGQQLDGDEWQELVTIADLTPA